MLYVNPLDTRMARSIRSVSTTVEEAKEKVALQELEHMFAYTLMREMHKTVDILGKNPTSREKDLYDEMFDDAISGEIARTGQLGIAKQIEQQIHAREKKTSETGKTVEVNTLK